MEPCSWPPAHNWFCSQILSVSPSGLVCYGAKNHLVVVEPAQTRTADQQGRQESRGHASPKCTVLHEAFEDRTRVSVQILGAFSYMILSVKTSEAEPKNS